MDEYIGVNHDALRKVYRQLGPDIVDMRHHLGTGQPESQDAR